MEFIKKPLTITIATVAVILFYVILYTAAVSAKITQYDLSIQAAENMLLENTKAHEVISDKLMIIEKSLTRIETTLQLMRDRNFKIDNSDKLTKQ